jgi:sodium transport system ATP-binding protein
MTNIILVENLTKSFRLTEKNRKLLSSVEKKITVLKKLSFLVRKGEIFGILGPNGAGKTTAMRIIAGLIKSDNGDVIVDGFSVRENTMEVKKRIGFLSDELKLDGYFSPSYLFDFYSALRGINKNDIRMHKEYLFNLFGIKNFSREKIAALSNGMRQKVALVLSIAHDPDIIIFDEPTNGLDIVAARTVIDFLIEMKNHGKSILLSTHILSLVENICDRVGIIIDGRLVFCDFVAKMNKEKTMEDCFFSLYDQSKIYKGMEILK